jgi:hypothetical protein
MQERGKIRIMEGQKGHMKIRRKHLEELIRSMFKGEC